MTDSSFKDSLKLVQTEYSSADLQQMVGTLNASSDLIIKEQDKSVLSINVDFIAILSNVLSIYQCFC